MGQIELFLGLYNIVWLVIPPPLPPGGWWCVVRLRGSARCGTLYLCPPTGGHTLEIGQDNEQH